MDNEANSDRNPAAPSSLDERPGITPEQKPAASSPVYETEQPDPAQSGAGRMGVGSITLAAIAAAVILSVVLYGLNSTPPAPQATTATPAAGGAAAKPASQAGKNGHG
jgi:hypothetical protein